ncbi:tetratricopeptide repeat protein [Granulicella arctica]|uniref:Tetratricopeptide (TPR) repeat protein n=1 Tax=Granulicella arctica TaxID=940613 RepID=A0A7Y9PDZ5_9BACT|nr:tetratricopeptide (TPR) repeat protein [Granulicella arctica]
MTRYSRHDVLRILHLQARQLAAWERAGLILPNQDYSFEELGQLRTVRDLRATRISARSIRQYVEAMQRVSGMRNALMESSAVRRGSRLAFRYEGTLLDPMTQQLSFDFDTKSGASLRVVLPSGAIDPLQKTLNTQDLFLHAVRLEENPKTILEAAALYEEILAENPKHAPAAINLGTIRYGQREFYAAENLYRQATLADPEYALAFFDLGNVLDEMQRLDEAITAYLRAIALVPQYADAHYNLALAYERQGQRRRALRHWLMYVRLDPVGPWASHAKGQAKKILNSERLTIVSRRGRLVAAS